MRTYFNPFSEEMGGYKYWIDSAKGIGVILIVVGHLLYNSNHPFIHQIIYSFHVPLFFILSGYLQKGIDRNKYLIRRFQRLMVPFFLYTMIGLPFWGYFIIRQDGTFLDVIFDTFYVKGTISNNPLWFLVVLFEISVMVFMLDLPRKNLWMQVIIYLISVLSSYYIYTADIEICNLFGVNRAILCFGFYVFGMILARSNEEILTVPVLLTSVLLNLIVGGIYNTKISIYGFRLGWYISFQIAAICGSIALMSFCRIWFNRYCYISRLSKYAIIILGTQYFVRVIFFKVVEKLSIAKSFKYDICMALVTAIIVCAIPKIYENIKVKIGCIKYFNGE